MGLTPAGFMPHNSFNGARASSYRLPFTLMDHPILLCRGSELCSWLPCGGDIVACSYGYTDKPGMKLYSRVSVQVAESQIEAHMEHGWKVVA